MANNNKPQAAPVAEQTISQSEAFFLKYKKAIIAAVVAIVVIIAGIVLYKTYYSGPREDKASTVLAKGQEYFLAGDYQKALNGDSASFKGFPMWLLSIAAPKQAIWLTSMPDSAMHSLRSGRRLPTSSRSSMVPTML